MEYSRMFLHPWRTCVAALIVAVLFATFGLTLTASAAGSGNGGGDNNPIARGRLTAMPASGNVGDWVIGGVTYTASGATEFKQEAGPFATGVCTKVEYTGAAAPFTAIEIETQSPSDCDGDGGGGGGGGGGNDGDLEAYGKLMKKPASGVAGEWVIGVITYTATTTTEVKSEFGPLDIGVCVKVHYFNTTTPPTAREIESEREFHCTGGSDDNGGNNGGDDGGVGSGELYGVLSAFPASLIGDWVIGGLTFKADAATEFQQKAGSFAISNTVKVEFTVNADSSLQAREIKTLFRHENNSDDDNGNGVRDGAEGHAYGKVEALPAAADRVGPWTIGGVIYTATVGTRFKDEHGPLQVGAQVRIKYVTDSAGVRTATEIKTTDDNGGVQDSTHAKLVGSVKSMPATGFKGTWTIGDASFVVNDSSRLKEDDGVLFAVGAYVEVEYSVVGTQNVVHEMETRIPPGAGDDDFIGKVDDTGGPTTAAAGATLMVNGRTFVLTPATNISENAGDLVVGSTVLVNSYLAADGSQVATLVRTVNLSGVLYLPLTRK